MSELGDDFKFMADMKKKARLKFGIPCPKCIELQPKRNPTILMPHWVCQVDRYKDQRPELTQADWDSI